MGLDITAYRKLKLEFESGKDVHYWKHKCLACGWAGDEVEEVFFQGKCIHCGVAGQFEMRPVRWTPGGGMRFSEENWPGRAEGLPSRDIDAVYSFEECMTFRAGSYSGYNEWRNWLAKVAGWKNAEAVWDVCLRQQIDSGPAFFELVNFADDNGVIGPVAAAKLAKDFERYHKKAEEMSRSDEWFFPLYMLWAKAFEMAADGGAVDFH